MVAKKLAFGGSQCKVAFAKQQVVFVVDHRCASFSHRLHGCTKGGQTVFHSRIVLMIRLGRDEVGNVAGVAPINTSSTKLRATARFAAVLSKSVTSVGHPIVCDPMPFP